MNPPGIPNEASQLAILASDASVHDKAIACHRLAHVAGSASVGPLAALLDHETLSDYARSGLEVIDDPAAPRALLDALPKLAGLRLSGAVNSLGVRREKSAVPALRDLAADPERGVGAEAVASLGMIGTPDAAEALLATLAEGPQDLRAAAGHSGLVAAGHLIAAGHADPAAKLLKAILAAFSQGPIHDAALRISR